MSFFARFLKTPTAFTLEEFDLNAIDRFKENNLTNSELRLVDHACQFINSVLNNFEKTFRHSGSIEYRASGDKEFLAKSEVELCIFAFNCFLREMKQKNTSLPIRAGIRYRLINNVLKGFQDDIMQGPYGISDKPVLSVDTLINKRNELFTTIVANQPAMDVTQDFSDFYAPLLTDIPFHQISPNSTLFELTLLGVMNESLPDRRRVTEFLGQIMGSYSDEFRDTVLA